MNNHLIKVKNMILSYWLYIMPHHLISRFTYIITRTHHPFTSFLIRLYVKIFKINLDECIEKNTDNYNTFCDFFTRKLKKGVHVVNKDKGSIVS